MPSPSMRKSQDRPNAWRRSLAGAVRLSSPGVSMNRERIAWLMSLVLVSMLAFNLPGSMARRDDEYAFVKSLIDIHREVASNYVEPVDEEKLQAGSINGMMSELDPYSI